MSLSEPPANIWLHRRPAPSVAGRVFCVPHAGSGASVFSGWPQQLGTAEVLAVELPGRLTRYGDTMPETFQDLAAAVIHGLRAYFDVPFAFFGHCWSALLAYEICRQLQSAGEPMPRHLFISSQVAPQDGPVGRMLDMTDSELAAELASSIQAQGRNPHPELVAIYLKVLRTDIEISRRYVVATPPRLDCPITAIGWTEDSEVRPDRMAGWKQCGDTTFELFSGGHHRFLDAPPELLEVIRAGFQ